MSAVFISHSSSDNDLGQSVATRLKRQNHQSIFLDFDPERGIVAGQSWERTLYRKIRAARAVIAIITDNYLRSHWCFAEIALARMEGKPIFALLTEPLQAEAKLPSILSEQQYIDLRSDPEEGYRRLWRGLAEIDLICIDSEWNPTDPPYLGLNAFQEKHAPVFFGREAEARAGIELLERGAPNVVMTLGASGSGKSSLVRAGIIPRLRRDPDQWLILGPIRPGLNPFLELAEAFVRSYRRYAGDAAARAGSAPELALRLKAWAAVDEASTGPDGLSDDERVRRLINQLEDLRTTPPVTSEGPFLRFLDWSLEDLQRICALPNGAGGQVPRGRAETILLDLADDLRRVADKPNASVLLVLDQFEELLSEGDDATTSDFLSLVRTSAEAEHSPLRVLGTMRSDFLGRFQRHPALIGLDFESLSLGPVRVEGLRRIITEPARMAMIELAPDLIERLLADTETPDALPLLSFTLWVLWRDYGKDGQIDVTEYEHLGGLDGAISSEADALFDPAKETQLANAFLHLARLNEEGQYARRTVPWDDPALVPVHKELTRFIERRLLVTRDVDGVRTIEVAHEALFRAWAPLKTWLDRERASLLLRKDIQRDAASWEAQNRPADNLWRGNRLLLARDMLQQDKLSGASEAFVRAGMHRRRRARSFATGLAACVFASLVGLLVWVNHERAKAEVARADAEVARADAVELRNDAVELRWDAEKARADAEKALAETVAAQDVSLATSKIFFNLVTDKTWLEEQKPGRVVAIDSADNIIVSDNNWMLFRRHGEGHVLAFAHDNFLSAQNLASHAMIKVATIYSWGEVDDRVISAAYTAGHCEVVTHYPGAARASYSLPVARLAEEGIELEALGGVVSDAALADKKILVIGNAWATFSDAEISAVEAFVRAGGLLITAGLAWSWDAYKEEGSFDPCQWQRASIVNVKAMQAYPMNDIVSRFGLRFE